ncbi:hypothetical protein TWF106_008807 [Orbilia oligospora]|uniref:Uncharacterized protein n=1 Tax=Orbilia oligospora TaxID=2813651 RepID=A0A6G1M493_ORBOL|nr:hypothetical protein TWF679_006615 [Orbilia oligospora]KAF3215300.1 hypothetical protein TWF106_008807 [Orbilia oligospora]KAF3227843.1 hypothetical protein TWF191_003365 [Orbilia oligospora]KAF3244707.1 hypothetical protein TWF192_007641 [Orbilia oligospora]
MNSPPVTILQPNPRPPPPLPPPQPPRPQPPPAQRSPDLASAIPTSTITQNYTTTPGVGEHPSAAAAIRQQLLLRTPSPITPIVTGGDGPPGSRFAVDGYQVPEDPGWETASENDINSDDDGNDNNNGDSGVFDKKVVHGKRLKLKKFSQLPDSMYPTKISTNSLYEVDSSETLAMFTRKTLITVPATTRTQILHLDPTMAVLERLLQQFRRDYLRTAIGTFSEARCKKMFLMKYRGYKFTQIRTNGRDVWGKWVVRQGFRKGLKGGCVIWRERKDLELMETKETDPHMTPRVIRRFASLFGIGKVEKGVTLRTCRSVGMGSGGAHKRNFEGYLGELVFPGGR